MLEKASQLLLGRLPKSTSDFETLGARLGKAIKRKPYTAYYVKEIILGNHAVSGPVNKAIENLIAELLAEPPKPQYRKVTVRVPQGVFVPENTIILRDAVACICGESFIPTIWNQKNHTRACAVLRERLGSGKK
jgi:hypothetical protein